MPPFVCPDCQAAIEADLIEKTGRAECPFCGGDLSTIGLPQRAATRASHRAGDKSVLDQGTSGGRGRITRPLPPLPKKSAIAVVESTPDRLVLFIPGGNKQSAGFGLFAVLWNGFMSVFTILMTTAILNDKGGDAPPLAVLIPFLSLFWGIGLGLAFFWLKFNFERTIILLDRDRIVIQKTFFGRKRLDETSLGPKSRAELVESYRQNDIPVDRVEVRGDSGTAKFGTALGEQEKNWLVDRINEFLGVPSAATDEVDDDEDDDSSRTASRPAARLDPNDCEKCGAPLAGQIADDLLTCAHCGAVHRGTPAESPSRKRLASLAERYERLTPDALPPESRIQVLESSPERLAFRLALPANSPLRWVVPLFAIPFAIGWYSFVIFFAWDMIRAPFDWFGIIPLLFLIPFVAAGLMPLGIGLYAIAGNTTVAVTRERVSCRWGVGPFGYSRHVPTAQIESVRVEDISVEKKNRGVRGARRRMPQPENESRACVVRAAGQMLPLTILEEVECSRLVASLVRTKLEELGHPLTDV
jgi:uncharacterized Zn finger protein (UPF0148 family)